MTEFGSQPGEWARIDTVPESVDIVLISRLLKGVSPGAALACLLPQKYGLLNP